MENLQEDIDSIDVSGEGSGEVKMARKALIRGVQQIMEHLEPAKARLGELLRPDEERARKRKRDEQEEIAAEEAKFRKRQEELAKKREAEEAEKKMKREKAQSEADKSK